MAVALAASIQNPPALLKDAASSRRGDIVRQIIEIVCEAARGLPPGEHDPLDDGMPGG